MTEASRQRYHQRRNYWKHTANNPYSVSRLCIVNNECSQGRHHPCPVCLVFSLVAPAEGVKWSKEDVEDAFQRNFVKAGKMDWGVLNPHMDSGNSKSVSLTPLPNTSLAIYTPVK